VVTGFWHRKPRQGLHEQEDAELLAKASLIAPVPNGRPSGRGLWTWLTVIAVTIGIGTLIVGLMATQY
jgi:hypothetical protein